MQYFFNELEWNKIFELPFRVTEEAKFQWMQFQILHRIIATNKYLYKLKLIDSPVCSFCKQEVETIEHLFFECFCVKRI